MTTVARVVGWVVLAVLLLPAALAVLAVTITAADRISDRLDQRIRRHVADALDDQQRRQYQAAREVTSLHTHRAARTAPRRLEHHR